jgi:DNA-binding transcriptional regulator LsrR (DeoR family)
MGRSRILPEETESEIAAVWLDFLPKPTLDQLASRYGVSRSTVQRILRRSKKEPE